MTNLPITAQGRYGQATFDGMFVTLTRSRAGRLLTGSTEKRFHVRNITGINFKPASAMFLGRIEFTLPGAVERRSRSAGSRSRTALEDENALTFPKKANADFQALKDAVYRAQATIL